MKYAALLRSGFTFIADKPFEFPGNVNNFSMQQDGSLRNPDGSMVSVKHFRFRHDDAVAFYQF